MELRQLEYFQMASRLRNITRAAERLRVSQPNITVAIKKLEAELGIQLFDRSQKQLSLTPEGAVFLNRIELALRNIQDAVLEVNDYKQLQMLEKEIRRRLKDEILLTPIVKLVPLGSLPVSEGKAVRVVDKRKVYQ